MDTTFEGLLIYEDEIPSTNPSRGKNTRNFAVGLEGYACLFVEYLVATLQHNDCRFVASARYRSTPGAANLPVTRKEREM